MRIIIPAAVAGALLSSSAYAQTGAAPTSNVLQQSAEYRFQLDLHVNDTALARMLPAGWVSNAATQGAAKDANLRLILIDEQNIVGADGKVLGKGSNRIAQLAAPVKSADGANTGQMVLGGLSEDTTPDGFGVYVKANAVKTSHSMSDANGVVTVSEDWDFAAPSGEHVQVHVKYTRQPANKGGGVTKFFNPANPAEVQTATTEQSTDITRNVTTNPPDRVVEFSLKAGGGKYATLFDGSEKPLSWDSQPVYSRIVSAN